MKNLVTVKLWNINRWLRWTGFRVCVTRPTDEDDPDVFETRIGVGWYGLYGSRGWRRIEPSIHTEEIDADEQRLAMVEPVQMRREWRSLNWYRTGAVVWLRCPDCGETSITVACHEVSGDGTVPHPLSCPEEECSFRQTPKLVGWCP